MGRTEKDCQVELGRDKSIKSKKSEEK